MLLKECKPIPTAELVNSIEKQKSKLRKLKGFCSNKKKQKEIRRLNRQFQQDTGKVFSSFEAMIAKRGSEDRPVYQPESKGQDVRETFDDVDQATSFWKDL